MADHTPTPWRQIHGGTTIVGPGGTFVADALVSPKTLIRAEPIANAAFILKAVNNHDALLEALTSVRAEVDLRSSPKLASKIDTLLAHVAGSSRESASE